MDEQTGTNVLTFHIRDGVATYPCRCGQEHSGDYAFEDWSHHNCFHKEPLVVLGRGQAVCGLCGASFGLDSTRMVD